LTFSDKDVDLNSMYGGGIMIDRKKVKPEEKYCHCSDMKKQSSDAYEK